MRTLVETQKKQITKEINKEKPISTIKGVVLLDTTASVANFDLGSLV